jgi:hypothetical protein
MSRNLPAALAVVAAAILAVPVATGSTQRRSFAVYGKPTRAQFVNHADDRERGNITNPFNAADLLPTPKNANKGKKGARAGDNAVFMLTLYSDRNLRHRVGIATYSCTFNFAHEAVCDADFQLKNGSMIGMGPAKLDASRWVLPVTGGTGRYVGAHGQVTSTAVGGTKRTQLIRFQLV